MEINLYGTINEQTVEQFNQSLRGNVGEVVVHINSNGGNIFSALAINSQLKAHNATAIIEGLCASAATLVALGAKKICMAKNALFMIHAPSTLLIDYVNAAALMQMQTTLEKIESSIVAIYQQRVPNFTMPENELWLNGTEAKQMGFVDEILDDVQNVYMDAAQKIIGYNGQYFNMGGCKTMPTQDLIADFKKEVKGPFRFTGLENSERIKKLQTLKGDDADINAIIDTAIKYGGSYQEVKNYIEKVKKPPAAQTLFNQVILDQMTSGAQEVSGSANIDEKTLRVNALMKAVNNLKK